MDSYCWQSWDSGVLDLPVEDQPPSTQRPQTLSSQSKWACTYQLSGDTLELVGTTQLDPSKIDEINVALQQSTADTSCDPRIGTRYTEIEPMTEPYEDTYVALDGCAVLQGHRWWHASDQLRALLAPANS